MNKLPLFLASCLFFMAPALCSAASLSFTLVSPGSDDTPARVAVVLDSSEALNAVEGSVVLPPNTAPSIRRGESAVGYWIEEPRYDPASQAIVFAGIMPGGATQGTLFEFDLPAQGTLLFSKARAYLDGPDATEAPLRLESLNLSPQPGGVVVLAVLLLLALSAAWILVRHLRAKWV